jgi:hypothetical protein
MTGGGGPSSRSESSLDLSGIRLSRQPLSLQPRHGGDALVLMGREDDVTAVLRAVETLPGVSPVPAPATTGRGARERLGRWLSTITGVRDAAHQQAALTDAGLAADIGPRTRMSDLDTTGRARVRIAAVALLGAHAPGTTHVVLDAPLNDAPGHQRAGLRSTLSRALTTHSLGAVLSTDSPVDALVLDARTIELDAQQVAQEGDPTTILGKPRGGLSASLARANVMSGLARRGWLSIGHSQVRRRTDLDGKVYLAIPTDAVALSVDEFDPSFRGEFVFETIVIGIRDDGNVLQVRLSPVDNEAGLPLVVDVLDASPRRAWTAITPALGGEADTTETATAEAGSGSAAENPAEAAASTAPDPSPAAEPAPASASWALLHPGLGPDLETQLGRIRMGSRLWAEVDTQRIHVWSVEV